MGGEAASPGGLESGPGWAQGPRVGGHVIIFSLGKTAIRLCEMILLAPWAPGMLASHE